MLTVQRNYKAVTIFLCLICITSTSYSQPSIIWTDSTSLGFSWLWDDAIAADAIGNLWIASYPSGFPLYIRYSAGGTRISLLGFPSLGYREYHHFLAESQRIYSVSRGSYLITLIAFNLNGDTVWTKPLTVDSSQFYVQTAGIASHADTLFVGGRNYTKSFVSRAQTSSIWTVLDDGTLLDHRDVAQTGRSLISIFVLDDQVYHTYGDDSARGYVYRGIQSTSPLVTIDSLVYPHGYSLQDGAMLLTGELGWRNIGGGYTTTGVRRLLKLTANGQVLAKRNITEYSIADLSIDQYGRIALFGKSQSLFLHFLQADFQDFYQNPVPITLPYGDVNPYHITCDKSGNFFITGSINGKLVIAKIGALPTSVETTLNFPPLFHSLLQNYPNPFNPSTTIRFSIPHSAFVTLRIFNALGEQIAALVSENVSAGTHQVEWNAQGLSSGVYFYRLQAGTFTDTKKLLLLR